MCFLLFILLKKRFRNVLNIFIQKFTSVCRNILYIFGRIIGVTCFICVLVIFCVNFEIIEKNEILLDLFIYELIRL